MPAIRLPRPPSPGRGARTLAALLAAAVVAGSAVPGRAAAPTLTLYAAQHHQMVDVLTAAFTKQTGIAVRTRYGEAPEMAAQIAREGRASPADLFFTENSPELTLLDEKGLLAPLRPDTLSQVPARYSAADGSWLGVLARENVLAFDPAKVSEAQLPASLLDLAQPAWKGRLGIAPSDADFLPLVEAVVVMKGRPAALEWLRGLKANAAVFDDDEGVVAAVERGSVAVGVINNYYYERVRVEQGKDKTRSRIHHFPAGDVGSLVNVSGAAVLKTSKNADAAQQFLAFLVSRPVQEMLGRSDIDFEYPLVPGVAANPVLVPLDQLHPPALTMKQLGDDQDAARLLRQAGLI